MRNLALAALLLLDLVALAWIGLVINDAVTVKGECDLLCSVQTAAPFVLLVVAGYATWRQVRRMRRA